MPACASFIHQASARWLYICLFLSCIQRAVGGEFSEEFSKEESDWVWRTCSPDKFDIKLWEPETVAQYQCTAHFKHFAGSGYQGGFNKLECSDGYAYLSTSWPDSLRIIYRCYKCADCEKAEWQDWDTFQDSRQVCEALPKCAAGKSGQCVCTDCDVGKANDGSNDFCTYCIAGTYASTTGKSKCDDCSAGHVSGTGWGHCDACAEGKKQTSASDCTDCPAGENNPHKAQVACFACDKGKYAASPGTINCALCGAGTYQNSKGQANCINCDPGLYKEKEGVNIVCDECLPGTYTPGKGYVTCLNCDAGKSSLAKESTCKDCVAGKYAFPAGSRCENCDWNTKSQSGAPQCTACEAGKFSEIAATACSSCKAGQHLNARFLSLKSSKNVITSIKDVVFELPCLWCAQCPLGTERARCLYNMSDPGTCMSCEAGKRLVLDTGICEPCPANQYREENNVTRLKQTECTMCPRYSLGPTGSNSLQNCECNAGFIRVYTDEQTFVCGCEFGRYIVNTQCEECGECIHGFYRSGCSGDNPGSCVQCNKQCSSDKQLAGCGGMHQGTCKKKTDLVRTPMCPAKQDYEQGLLSPSAGYGLYDFTSVFRASPHVLDFRCSDVCDGTTSFDTIECDGPYACNMATCAEDVTELGNMIPVRACPVIITNEDDENTIRLKRGERCVPCKDCGSDNYLTGSSLYNDWGGGCVRECSQLLCTAGMVWDWTRRRCSTCDSLSDIRLCNKRDTESMSLVQSTVTGNLPLLFFADCKAGGRNLYEIGYGKCVRCDQSQHQCLGQTFPAQCKNGASVLCKTCSRSAQALYIDVLQGRWLDAAQEKALHCQISGCKQRNGLQWTGVESSGKLCRRLCTTLVCAADERLVPCRLPHQARCEALFPALLSVPAEMQTNIFYAGKEINLLNEAKRPDDVDVSTYDRGVASFENIAIVLQGTLEYQCVWNADGIIDNTATPAGISHVMWAAGQTADELYRKRGTRACRVWDVPEDVEMPLLPLQNTISCSAQEDSATKCLDRYMLVNTEAYALSYKFSGDFGIVASEPSNINAKFTSTLSEQSDRMLGGEHVSSIGKLFLMLRMYQNTARLAANVPNDRQLHNAQWLKAFLVSFAVVDLTEYTLPETQANIRVVPSMSVHEQVISDAADSFIPELFWSQPVSGSEWQHKDSIFGVYANGFGGRSHCTHDTEPKSLASINLAPWDPTAYNDYSWVEQRDNSSVPLEVSMTCLFNNIVSECFDMKNVVEVFVLLRSYEATKQNQPVFCNSFLCSDTSDKTLLALRNVHKHIRGAPVADRFKPGPSARVLFQLQETLSVQISIQQAHASSAYAQCALLLTTSVINTQYSTQQSVLCVGGDGLYKVRSELVGTKYSGALSAIVDDRPVLLLLLGSLNVLYKSLNWQNVTASPLTSMNETETFKVLESDTYASAWLSVAMLGNNLTALYIDSATESAALGFFSLVWASPTELALKQRHSSVSLAADWSVHFHPWQDYSRVIVSAETENILVVSVESQTSDELRNTALVLRVCVCYNKGTVCSAITLSEMSVSSNPSFISAAYMQQAAGQELWAISVNGKTHEAIFSHDTLILTRMFATDLENKHFVKVEHLFYCFVVSDSGDAVQPSVLTYLPNFKSWRSVTHSSLPSVYAVVIVPSAGAQNASDTTYASTQESDNLKQYMSSSNVSVSEYDSKSSSVIQKVLQLKLRWASYIVQQAGSAAQPVYERTAEATSGDEATQLLVSPHVVNPRAQFPRSLLSSYAMSSNNLTLNRAFGLPSLYGRYEQVGSECAFHHYRTGHQKEHTTQRECVEDAYVALTVSGAKCNDESFINGIYTYYNWTDPDVVKQAGALAISAADMLLLNITTDNRPVYARRSSATSSVLSTAPRFIYYDKVVGWTISEVIGRSLTSTCLSSINGKQWNDLPEDCGNIKALWTGHENKTRPPSTSSIQICKDEGSKYYASESATLTSTLTPKCCKAGEHIAAGVCTACAPGQYSNAGWNFCAACEPGKYSAISASSACTECVVGKHAPEFGAVICEDCASTSLCAAALQKPGIAIFYRQKTLLGQWLRLLFSVPCGSRLQPFVSKASECKFSEAVVADTICAQHSNVVVLINTEGAANTKIIFNKDDTMQTILLPHCPCIYMELGVLWIDAAMLAQNPSNREIDILLRRSSQISESMLQDSELRPPSALPLPGTWRRERHVLSLTPRKDMFVELFFTRDNVESSVKVAVGVDDVQLTPVLSDFPAISQDKILCTLFRIPSADQLATIGLAHLLRGNHSMSHDDWARLDVTLGLSLTAISPDNTDCQFTSSLFYPVQDGSCTEDPGRPAHTHNLHRLGCSLAPAKQHVLGLYAECQIAIPTFLTSVERLGVAVRAADNTTCSLGHGAEVVVSLRPHTQLFSCPLGQFLNFAGTCESCHRSTQVCALGSRLRGCPALEPADPDNCILCTEGRELVQSGAAQYVARDAEPCSWNCSAGYFLFQLLGQRSCQKCGLPSESGCDSGFIWQECSFAQDSACVPCPDLRLKSGPYAVNEQYLDIVNKSNTCQTTCKPGSYRAYDGLCKRCWDRKQLLLHAGSGFFFFEPCTDTRNAQAIECVTQPGELILSSDPGEGTVENPFTRQCVTECLPGWYAHNNACKQCWPPLEVVQAKLTQAELPAIAYTWIQNVSTPCAFECNPPYTRTGSEAAVHTCVLCSDVCETGTYPAGPYCKCSSCLM
jgi:hypothetical protein